MILDPIVGLISSKERREIVCPQCGKKSRLEIRNRGALPFEWHFKCNSCNSSKSGSFSFLERVLIQMPTAGAVLLFIMFMPPIVMPPQYYAYCFPFYMVIGVVIASIIGLWLSAWYTKKIAQKKIRQA